MNNQLGVGSFLQNFMTSFQAAGQMAEQRKQMEMQRKLIDAQLKASNIETQMKQQKIQALMSLLSGNAGGQAPSPMPGQSASPGLPQAMAGQAVPTPNIPMASSSPTAPAASAGGNNFDEFIQSPKGQILSHALFGFAPPPTKAMKAEIADAEGKPILQMFTQTGQKIPGASYSVVDKTLTMERQKNQAEKEKNLPKLRDSFLNLNRQWDMIDKTIDEASNLASPMTTGPAAILSNIPGTPQKTLQQKLLTIKANIGFDRLQQMRQDSPTGGALGNVSNLETELLQAVQGSLAQSLYTTELKANLANIRDNLAKLRAERANAFMTDYGFIPKSATTKSSKPTLTPGKTRKPLTEFDGGK